MHPTLLDIAIGLFLILNILGACHRGLGREMLHTFIFALLVAGGYVMFRNSSPMESAEQISFWVVNSSYYLITAYVLTWIGIKVLSPIILGPQTVGLRSRFWSGALSIGKLATVILGLNLWFAMHSEAPHPKRLESLPPIMQSSLAIRISDKLTEDLYHWLAANNVVEYKKNLYRKPTPEEEQEQKLEEQLGIAPTGI
jgi:hypothetical protein